MQGENKKNHKIQKFSKKVASVVMVIEAFLAVLIIAVVFISATALFYSLIRNGLISELLDYDAFQNMLSYLLMLIIGLELAVMLIKHEPSNVIDVMIYAIARKMLIYTTATLDMLIGVVALGMLFLIKFFLKNGPHLIEKWNELQQREKQDPVEKASALRKEQIKK